MAERMRARAASLPVFLLALVTVASSGSGVFSEDVTPLELTLAAPFETLFASTDAEPDHIVVGTLSYRDPLSGEAVSLSGVAVSTRGNTSRQSRECSFPKLKLGFEDAPAGSVFEGIDSIKIGTHCGERADDELTPKFGRLANEKAPHREALVYRLLRAVSVPTLLARPARITYEYRSGRVHLVRNAMLLEDDEAAVARIGGRSMAADEFGSARQSLDLDDTVRLSFAQAMVGNFDWCLRMFPGDTYRCHDTHPLWNLTIVERPDATAVPLIHDFDLAGMVVGRHNWFDQVFNRAFAASPIEIEVVSQLQRARALFPRAVLDRTRRGFLDRKAAAYEALRQAPVDEDGRSLAASYLDHFYSAIESDAAFYRPVVVQPDTAMFAGADRRHRACGAETVPIGTPVKPVGSANGMIEVVLLDASWQWTKRCEALRTQPVWIAEAAVGTEFPR